MNIHQCWLSPAGSQVMGSDRMVANESLDLGSRTSLNLLLSLKKGSRQLISKIPNQILRETCCQTKHSNNYLHSFIKCYWCWNTAKLDILVVKTRCVIIALLSSECYCSLFCQWAAQPDGVCVVGVADGSGSGVKRRLRRVLSCCSAVCRRIHFQPSERMGSHSQVPAVE